MHITTADIITFLLSIFGGGGTGYAAVRLFMQKEAKEALKDEIVEIKKNIEGIQDNYVTCKFCNMQHSNLDGMLKSIDGKLDILIAHKG